MKTRLELLEAKIRIYNIIIEMQLKNWDAYVQAKPFLEAELTKIEEELNEAK